MLPFTLQGGPRLGQVLLDAAEEHIVALDLLDQERVERQVACYRDLVLIIRSRDLCRHLELNLDKLLPIVLEDHHGLLAALLPDIRRLTHLRPLDDKLVLVSAVHDVRCHVHGGLCRRALMQAKDPRLILIGELILHVVAHVLHVVDQGGHEVAPDQSLAEASAERAGPHLCRLLNLLCSQVVQFLRVRELVMLCIDSTCDHTRTVEHLLVEEMLDRLVEGQLILVIDELAAIVQLAY